MTAPKIPATGDRNPPREDKTHQRPSANGHAPRQSPRLPASTTVLPVTVLVRHPDNRRPSDQQVATLQRSLASAGGQLEPVLVRRLPPGHPHRGAALDGSPIGAQGDAFQIVSGETRSLALWAVGVPVVCRVIEECDDARALVLLAEGNAARADLDPIQKARLIETLCRPATEGGGGLTREAAGRIYGLSTGGAASNLARLLALPEPVQQLVAAGTLPESFARAMLPFCVVPGLVDRVAKLAASWDDATRPDRSAFTRNLSAIAQEKTRSMTDGRKQLNSWNVDHTDDRLFDADAATRDQLQVVDLPLWGKRAEPRACNVRLWDKLQAPAREAAKKRLAKKGVAQAREMTSGAPRTAADQERLEREQDAQLAKRVTAWRHAWLCQLVAERLRALGPGHWTTTKLVLWCLTNHHRVARMDFERILDEALAGQPAHQAETLTAEQASADMLLAVLARALEKPPRNPDWPDWPTEFVDQLAGDVGVDLEAAWRALQVRANDQECRLETFFLLHGQRQLEALAEELDINLFGAGTKSAKVAKFTKSAKVLRLPKSIRPLAASKRKTRQSRAKPR